MPGIWSHSALALNRWPNVLPVPKKKREECPFIQIPECYHLTVFSFLQSLDYITPRFAVLVNDLFASKTAVTPEKSCNILQQLVPIGILLPLWFSRGPSALVQAFRPRRHQHNQSQSPKWPLTPSSSKPKPQTLTSRPSAKDQWSRINAMSQFNLRSLSEVGQHKFRRGQNL